MWKEEFKKQFKTDTLWLSEPIWLEDFIQTEIIEAIINEEPKTPESWDTWSVERQLGYNLAISNRKEQLRNTWL